MIAAHGGSRRSRTPGLVMHGTGAPMHPNEVDLRRVLAALDRRTRYRYVTPEVLGVESGYLVTSPCCSRNVDAQGGVIQIAWLRHDPTHGEWCLYRRDHAGATWVLHRCDRRMATLLELLSEDPARVFWP